MRIIITKEQILKYYLNNNNSLINASKEIGCSVGKLKRFMNKYDLESKSVGRIKDIKGLRFGRILVIELSKTKSKEKHALWKCKCDCGQIKIIKGSALLSGNTKSCGCLSIEKFIKRNTKHNMSRSLFYGKFKDIIQRCNNQKNKRFKDYGDRGIKCEWLSFEEFKKDMYSSYLKHKKEFGGRNTSIERINNLGSYNKDNCKWATSREQARNRKTNHLITYKKETKCLIDWAEKFGLSYSVLDGRLRLEWSMKEALLTPIKKHKI